MRLRLASNALVVHYLDHWNFDFIWLPVMYLSSLNIRMIDGNSGLTPKSGT
jgi:hypothetical protein